MKTMQSVFQSGVISIFIMAAFTVRAQQQEASFDNRINLLFGLNQLVLNGFNVEGNLFYKRLAFDYSHGVSLDFSGNNVSGSIKEQRLAVHMPYTTGFGVGYRFTHWLNVRLEPKWHRFEIYYNGDAQTLSNRIVGYNTFSLGLGAYASWLPFKHSQSGWKGIMISPSLRYWPTMSSTLTDNKFAYDNKLTGKREIHERMQPVINNKPVVFNISFVY